MSDVESIDDETASNDAEPKMPRFTVRTVERLSKLVGANPVAGGSAVTDTCSGEKTNGTNQGCCCS